MKQLTIGKNEDGKRVDAIAALVLPKAGKGFIYKMLRKKNIVLNGKKAEGNDRVSEGDVVTFFLSDETIRGFSETGAEAGQTQEELTDRAKSQSTEADKGKEAARSKEIRAFSDAIIYEDEDVILINKPAGMLSQKAVQEDVSTNELLIAYLLDRGRITEEELKTFRPSVCNRLDRNTSGILCAGVSLKGLRELTALIRERRVDKYYMCIVKGVPAGKTDRYTHLVSYLSKDGKSNKVEVRNREFEGSEKVEIEYMPVRSEGGYTLMRVKLITGKSHQIRAQLASIGHPIAGDPKYGDRKECERLKKQHGVKRQLLSAVCMSFPEDTRLEPLKGRKFSIVLPKDFFICG